MSCGDGLSNPSCLIDGNLTLNGSITETKTVIVVGVVNVTGDVTVVGRIILKIAHDAALHVGRCLVLDEHSDIVVVVEGTATNNTAIVTYDAPCSTLNITNKVKIETSSLDECEVGRPYVTLQEGNGRARLELVLAPVDNTGECAEKLNVLAISIAVPIVVLVLIAVVIIFAVPKVRAKVVPSCHYACSK